MEKLIRMTDFIVEQIKAKVGDEPSTSKSLEKIKKYAEFLRQPLTLGMFVPCDRDGKPLEEYKKSAEEETADNIAQCRVISLEEIKWIKAKQEVLFGGFEWDGDCATNSFFSIDDEYVSYGWTIEDIIDWNLRLTENAVRYRQNHQITHK